MEVEGKPAEEAHEVKQDEIAVLEQQVRNSRLLLASFGVFRCTLLFLPLFCSLQPILKPMNSTSSLSLPSKSEGRLKSSGKHAKQWLHGFHFIRVRAGPFWFLFSRFLVFIHTHHHIPRSVLLLFFLSSMLSRPVVGLAE